MGRKKCLGAITVTDATGTVSLKLDPGVEPTPSQAIALRKAQDAWIEFIEGGKDRILPLPHRAPDHGGGA